jgi:hypothetical protein
MVTIWKLPHSSAVIQSENPRPLLNRLIKPTRNISSPIRVKMPSTFSIYTVQPFINGQCPGRAHYTIKTQLYFFEQHFPETWLTG